MNDLIKGFLGIAAIVIVSVSFIFVAGMSDSARKNEELCRNLGIIGYDVTYTNPWDFPPSDTYFCAVHLENGDVPGSYVVGAKLVNDALQLEDNVK